MNKELSAQTTAATVPQFDLPQFDLNNQQHLAMRKLMADVYSRHSDSLEHGLKQSASRYYGMAQGLARVALYVLQDYTLAELCNEMVDSMLSLDIAREAA